MLTVKDLHKSYQVGKTTYEVLKGVSLTVEKGEFVAVMGPSGSGKTTLLNCISCYIPIDSGEIMLGDRQLANLSEDALAKVRNRQLGFVFQDFNLLDTFSLQDNIYLPLVLAGRTYKEMEKRLLPLAKRLNIHDLLKKYPYEISGGQKQRTLIARALCATDRLLILDEPITGLDPSTTQDFYRVIRHLNREEQVAVLMVSHDIQNIVAQANKILHLKQSVLFYGSVEDYKQTECGREFLGGGK